MQLVGGLIDELQEHYYQDTPGLDQYMFHRMLRMMHAHYRYDHARDTVRWIWSADFLCVI